MTAISSFIPKIILDLNDAKSLGRTSVIVILSVIAALIAAKCASRRYGSNSNKTIAAFTLVTLAVAVYSCLFFGPAMTAVKGVALTIILLTASVADLKTMECPDYLHVMIFIASLIGTNLESVPYMALSALFAVGVMLLTLMIVGGNIGGADIKIVTASSFALGMIRGTAGLISGLMLSVFFNLSKNKRKKGFPMIPYLAAGYIAAFFIQI